MTLKKCSQFVSHTNVARLKQSFSLFPPRKLLIWTVNSLIAQSHYCISNYVKVKLSRKFHGEMAFFAFTFTKPLKICFFFLHFCLRSVFTLIFQGHVKVALKVFLLKVRVLHSWRCFNYIWSWLVVVGLSRVTDCRHCQSEF